MVRRIAQLMLQKYNVSRFVGAASDLIIWGKVYLGVHFSF